MKYRYGLNTSSNNYTKHLRENHQNDYNELMSKKESSFFKNIRDSLIDSGASVVPKASCSKSNKMKSVHGLRLALLAAECYIAPHVFNTTGFRRFLKSYGINTADLPTDRNILDNSLEKLYLLCLEAVKKFIATHCPKKVCSISTDSWTDSHLGMTYINYNLIFFLNEKLETILLETAPFNSHKSGENLLEDLKRVSIDFQIIDRKIVIINDGARNNEKLAKLSLSEDGIDVVLRIVCVGHNIHNLLYTDVLTPNKTNPFLDSGLTKLNAKINKIHQKLHYRKFDLKNAIKKRQSDLNWDKVLSGLEEHEDYTFDFDNLLPKVNVTHIKKNNSTRWMSTLAMLRSFLPITDEINGILCAEKKYHLLLDESDVHLLKDLESIYSIFEEAVLSFQVSKYD